MVSAISLALGGLYGRAYQALVSTGVAPNFEEAMKLLLSKHPKCDSSFLSGVILMAILRSFPKLTAAGPTGLRVQHISRLHFSLPLKAVVGYDLLASGRCSSQLPVFLQVETCMTALNDCPLDFWPIA